jgi:hypothetical protein
MTRFDPRPLAPGAREGSRARRPPWQTKTSAHHNANRRASGTATTARARLRLVLCLQHRGYSGPGSSGSFHPCAHQALDRDPKGARLSAPHGRSAPHDTALPFAPTAETRHSPTEPPPSQCPQSAHGPLRDPAWFADSPRLRPSYCCVRSNRTVHKRSANSGLTARIYAPTFGLALFAPVACAALCEPTSTGLTAREHLWFSTATRVP